MSKSYVSLDTKVCQICGKQHEVGVLLDRRLKDSMEKNTITGYELCPEHQKLKDEGYIFIIEVSNTPENGDRMKMENAERTGKIASIKRILATEILNIPIVELVYFVDHEVFNFLNTLNFKNNEA